MNASDNAASRKLIEAQPCPFCGEVLGYVHIERSRAYHRQCDCGARGPECALSGDHNRAFVAAIEAWNRRVSPGLPMNLAPRDGSAFLATGVHTHAPADAQRVQAGDRWWAILLFNVWQAPHGFVFAKDGKPPWSEPQRWCPLPDVLMGKQASPCPWMRRRRR